MTTTPKPDPYEQQATAMYELIACVHTHGSPLAIPRGCAEYKIDSEVEMCTFYQDTIGICFGDAYLVVDPFSSALRLKVMPKDKVKPAGTSAIPV